MTGQALVRFFDFTRVLIDFVGWAKGAKITIEEDLFFNHIKGSICSYANGRQIIRSILSKEDMVREWQLEFNLDNREYETFLIQDWKNNVLTEVSAAPGHTANYFTESELPFEISPVFFRPDVLLKYKSDPEKYSIRDRAISCRNSWYLKTYDINDAGQVSTYIVYLRDLPIEEQKHWKLYNEAPKAPLSSRAIKTDFKGEWDNEYDPLRSLKDRIISLDGSLPSWWSERGEDVRDACHYPVSTSAKEWADELLALSQMVNEGFLAKALKRMADRLGGTVEKQWASLKLIEAIFELEGMEPAESKAILQPLRELQHLRTKVRGHATREGVNLMRDASRQHGSLGKHYRSLVAACDTAMGRIITELEKPLPASM